MAINVTVDPETVIEPHRFIQDDDTHWYFIPVRLAELFEQWVAAHYTGEEDHFDEHDFGSYSIDGGPEHYFFTQTLRSMH